MPCDGRDGKASSVDLSEAFSWTLTNGPANLTSQMPLSLPILPVALTGYNAGAVMIPFRLMSRREPTLAAG